MTLQWSRWGSTTPLAGTLAGAFQDAGGAHYNLLHPKYGINPANMDSNDNTTKIQAWANDVCAANGVGVIPAAARQILFKSPVTFQPQSGNLCTIAIICEWCAHNGWATPFNFTGLGNTGVFIFKGLRNSYIGGLGVSISTAGQTGIAAYDFQFSTTLNNAGFNLFDNCFVQFQSVPNCVGFRLGQFTDGSSNAPFLTFRRCQVTDTSTANNNIGFQLGGSQNYCTRYEQCSGSSMRLMMLNGAIATHLTAAITSNTQTTITVADTSLFPSPCVIAVTNGTTEQIFCPGGVNNTATTFGSVTRGYNGTTALSSVPIGSSASQYVSGQGVYTGNGALMWEGGGASQNAGDFRNVGPNGNCFLVRGSRFELGKRLYEDFDQSTGFASHVTFDGCNIAQYSQPSDANGCLYTLANAGVKVRGCNIYSNTSQFNSTTNPFWGNSGAPSFGSFAMEDCTIYGVGTTPFFVNNAQGWPQSLRNVQIMPTSGGTPTSVVNALANGAV